MDTLCQLYDFRAPNESPCAVAYHPHQQTFACGFRNGAVRIFHIGTASMLAEHKEHRGMVTGLAFSPNAEHLYSAGSLGILVLCEGSTEEFSVVRILVNTVCRGDHLSPGVLSVSEDSQRVAVIGPSEFLVTVMDSRTLDEVGGEICFHEDRSSEGSWIFQDQTRETVILANLLCLMSNKCGCFMFLSLVLASLKP